MGGRHRREPAQAGDAGQDPLRHRRMLAHLGVLRRRQPARLVEDPVGDPELADVVQQRGAAERAQRVRVRPQVRGEARGDQARAVGVVVGPGRLGVDHAREGLRDAVQALLVGGQDALGRLPRRHVAGEHGGPERAIAAQGAQQPGQHRVEPRPAAPAGDLAGRLGAARGVEDLRRLREAEDAPEQRDRGTGQAARLPFAVPVLVERADRLRRARGEAQQPRDLRPAIAARLHQRARHLPLFLDRLEAPGTVADGAARRHRAQRPEEGREAARPVDALGGVLGLVVVGAEQGGHAGRVGRAARVLEQQPVEQVRAGLGVELQFLRHPHPDDAGAAGVARRLALREVERVGEAGHHLRQCDASGVGAHRGLIMAACAQAACASGRRAGSRRRAASARLAP